MRFPTTLNAFDWEADARTRAVNRGEGEFEDERDAM